MSYDNANDIVDEHFRVTSFEKKNWFRNINERKQFYFRFSSTVILPMSQNKL